MGIIFFLVQPLQDDLCESNAGKSYDDLEVLTSRSELCEDVMLFFIFLKLFEQWISGNKVDIVVVLALLLNVISLHSGTKFLQFRHNHFIMSLLNVYCLFLTLLSRFLFFNNWHNFTSISAVTSSIIKEVFLNWFSCFGCAYIITISNLKSILFFKSIQMLGVFKVNDFNAFDLVDLSFLDIEE